MCDVIENINEKLINEYKNNLLVDIIENYKNENYGHEYYVKYQIPYDLKNKEKNKERMKKYRIENKEKIKISQKEYNKKNNDKFVCNFCDFHTHIKTIYVTHINTNKHKLLIYKKNLF